MPFIIHRKPPYRIYVEEGSGGAMAHVAELPGCFAVGTDAARAVGAVPRAIGGFLGWLRAHGEPLVAEAYVARPSMADLFVAEIQKEVEPVTETEPADVRERLDIIRGIFERRVRGLPPGRRRELVLPVWTDRPDELWTLAKVLRRALEHEREHLAEL